jgi:hypothetical protein
MILAVNCLGWTVDTAFYFSLGWTALLFGGLLLCSGLLCGKIPCYHESMVNCCVVKNLTISCHYSVVKYVVVNFLAVKYLAVNCIIVRKSKSHSSVVDYSQLSGCEISVEILVIIAFHWTVLWWNASPHHHCFLVKSTVVKLLIFDKLYFDELYRMNWFAAKNLIVKLSVLNVNCVMVNCFVVTVLREFSMLWAEYQLTAFQWIILLSLFCGELYCDRFPYADTQGMVNCYHCT